jgi:hypothetical protein
MTSLSQPRIDPKPETHALIRLRERYDNAVLTIDQLDDLGRRLHHPRRREDPDLVFLQRGDLNRTTWRVDLQAYLGYSLIARCVTDDRTQNIVTFLPLRPDTHTYRPPERTERVRRITIIRSQYRRPKRPGNVELRAWAEYDGLMPPSDDYEPEIN